MYENLYRRIAKLNPSDRVPEGADELMTVCLEMIKPKLAEVLEARYVACKTQEEIADEWGISRQYIQQLEKNGIYAIYRMAFRRQLGRDEIERMGFSVRAERVIRQVGCKTAKEVLNRLDEIELVKGAGAGTMCEIVAKCTEYERGKNYGN